MNVQYEVSKLPKKTTSLFAQDPSGLLLWFPSPPVNAPFRSDSATGRAKHSLEYLHWRAMLKEADKGLKQKDTKKT
ncbi:hypothetical protein BDP27DRAFT_1321917 [Rhodocollybia butyracea]|uniref:Uncharacterized protein n=1 Tax=Rhodocollybia butyracea TaxID=206335 RepID=A0A9P5UA13_9AGAR|nr:hypothetical protein BDP27DRAFT_1321917 [Rhodocollybia butyracea]